jgi:hypothetical protein
MGKNGFQLDIVGFEKQIEQLKLKISQGVIDSFNSGECQEYLKSIMKFYIQECVYEKYTPDESNPKAYHRTYALRDNVTAKVIGDTLFIYVDDTGMDKPNGQWSYPWRVILGDSIYPYDYPVEGAGFMESRDWREITKEELIGHMNQSKIVLNIIKNAIQRRI